MQSIASRAGFVELTDGETEGLVLGAISGTAIDPTVATRSAEFVGAANKLPSAAFVAIYSSEPSSTDDAILRARLSAAVWPLASAVT